MKRRLMWASLAGAAVIATGVTTWAVWGGSESDAESKTASAIPGDQEASLLFQTALLQQKYEDPRGAASTYQRLLTIDPQNKLAWYNLGLIAQQSGSTGEARADYEKALKIDPRFTSALYNEAILVKESEPDVAEGLLERAITADPKASTAHLQLGLILAEKKRSDDAAEEFRLAVTNNPSLLSQVPKEFRDSMSSEASPERNSSPAGSSE